MYNQVPTGIQECTDTFPAVILVPKKQENLNFAFDGVDNSTNYVRAITVCSSAFQRVAVNNILKNLKLQNLPYITATPFDYAGNATGLTPYNFCTLLPFFKSHAYAPSLIVPPYLFSAILLACVGLTWMIKCSLLGLHSTVCASLWPITLRANSIVANCMP